MRTVRLLLLVLLGAFAGTAARAQLSPGPLSRAHEDLDSPLRCLECHGAEVVPGAVNKLFFFDTDCMDFFKSGN